MTKRAFVTGGTGFIGHHVVAALRAEGYEVVAAHRPGSKADALGELGARTVGLELTDPNALREVMPEAVDAVLHLAASTSIWPLEEAAQRRANVEITRRVVDAAIERGARRFVHCSSQAVYGRGARFIDEGSEKAGRDSRLPYYRTKYIAERTVLDARSRGLDPVVLNPAHVLGPRDRGNWSRMIRMVSEGSLPGVPPGAGSFCDARDVAQAMVRAIDVAPSGATYLLGGHDATYLEVIQEIASLLGRPRPRRTLPTALMHLVAHAQLARGYLTGRAPDITPDGVAIVTKHVFVRTDRAKRELGYANRPLRESLADTIAWMRSVGAI